MEWWVTLLAGLAILVAIFLTGAPIFLAFLIIIISGVVLMLGDAAFGMVVNSMYETATTASLGTVPLFILLGEILFRSGSHGGAARFDRQAGRPRARAAIRAVDLAVDGAWRAFGVGHRGRRHAGTVAAADDAEPQL